MSTPARTSLAGPFFTRPEDSTDAPSPAAPEAQRPRNPPSPWNLELSKFLFKDVEVSTVDGEVIVGKLWALNYGTLSCVVMTEEHKIIVRDPMAIGRKRTPRE